MLDAAALATHAPLTLMGMSDAGLILAAGGGSRFGGTKQLADLRGRPLLSYALAAMTEALDRVVVVLGHEAELIRARVDFGRAEVVIAQDWASGQAASLRRGIEAVADADAVVVTLGDQPLITPRGDQRRARPARRATTPCARSTTASPATPSSSAAR